jgi:hypothetical protein
MVALVKEALVNQYGELSDVTSSSSRTRRCS